jgi:hypothetical protein
MRAAGDLHAEKPRAPTRNCRPARRWAAARVRAPPSGHASRTSANCGFKSHRVLQQSRKSPASPRHACRRRNSRRRQHLATASQEGALSPQAAKISCKLRVSGSQFYRSKRNLPVGLIFDHCFRPAKGDESRYGDPCGKCGSDLGASRRIYRRFGHRTAAEITYAPKADIGHPSGRGHSRN